MSHVIDFIFDLKFDDLPQDVVDAAIRGLTDTLGVGVAGTSTVLSSIIANHAASQFGAGDQNEATLWLYGRKVSAAGAALSNGMTIDSVDAHDGYKPAKGHVGCGVVAATLALAEATQNYDAKDFLTAIIMGYEIGSRAGETLHATACDYHTTGAWIAVTVAAVAGRYLDLSRAQMREALGIAEYHGPRSQMMRVIDHPTMLKDGSGWGAMAGVSAAYLARDGFTGAPAVSVEADDVQSFYADLGKNWLVKEQYIKLYPVCRWAQPPVQAVLDLQAEHNFSVDDIASVEVETFHEAKRLATRHPVSSSEAQYSLPYPVAMALLHGTITAEHVSEEALNEPRAVALCDLIEITEAEEFNAVFPQQRLARVKIGFRDGSQIGSAVTEAIGDPENPVDNETICEKFVTLSAPVLGDDAARSLLELVQTLPTGDSIKPLVGALAKQDKAESRREALPA